MSALRLLIDAGNSRVKWAIVEANQWRSEGSAPHGSLEPLAAVVQPGMPCHVASVASASDESALRALLTAASVEPRWLQTAQAGGGVINGYREPAQLGADRWLGLVAARQRVADAVLVVSLGTALTVDALDATGQFLGGLILPGFALMQRALAQGTARVDVQAGVVKAFPQTTADAVRSGIIAALCGAIEAQFARLAAVAGHRPKCLVTGGDAQQVLPHLSMNTDYVPHLVLEGIEWRTREREGP